MDLASQYCPTRREIEERSWVLVTRLSCLSSRLLDLIGDHLAFDATKGECADLRTEITELGRRLHAHRSAHNC